MNAKVLETICCPSGAPNDGVGSAAERVAAIASYAIDDIAAQPEFDDLVSLTARICAAPYAAITFLDEQCQHVKFAHGVEPGQTPLSVSFCNHALDGEDIFTVPDARADSRFAANPLVVGPPHIRFYAGHRILAFDGTPIGALCVFDSVARPAGLDHTQRMALKVLTAQVESLLELRRSVLDRQTQLAAQSALARRLRHVADHDALTGLPQRRLFTKRVIQAARDAQRGGGRVAMMLVDVDHFKQINDSLGHDTGDAMLRRFAARLRAAVRSSDTVARLGGDEFGVLLGNIQHEQEIESLAASLNARLQEPIRHRGRMLECRASIGVACFPDHANSVSDLAKCCDLALAEAKRTRGGVQTFCHWMGAEFERETKVLAVVRNGLSEDRFVPHYQPKIDLRTGRIVGFESLLRFETAGEQPQLPENFIQAFSDRELAPALSMRMITAVLDDLRGWQERGLPVGRLAINTGAMDFCGDDFAEKLLEQIAMRDLDPSTIEVEVTEGVFLGRGTHHVQRALSVLNRHGVRIALDDFGTGYASLTHLRQFKVDTLKIDRSFIAGIGSNSDDTAIVRALISLGTSLGIETVAEGLENEQQAAFARSAGCDLGQGYLFGAAQPARIVPEMLGRSAPKRAA